MTVTLAPSPVAELADRDADVLHTVCCIDDNLALCSVDLTGVPWVEGESSLCRLCVQAFGDRMCPKGGRCAR